MTALTRVWRFPESIDDLWRALTDPIELAAWLLPNDFVPRVGHRFTLRGGDRMGLAPTVPCEVLEIDPPRRLVLAWDVRPGSASSTVEFTLRRIGGETELRIRHSSYERAVARAGPETRVWDWDEQIRRALQGVLRRTAAHTPGEVRP